VGGPSGLHCGLILGLFGGLLCVLACSPLNSHGIRRLAQCSFAWLYIPYLLSYVLLIGQASEGRQRLLFTLAVVVFSDAGAYYCGRVLGRRKLYETVSPRKTIEGSVGGLILSVVMGVGIGRLLLPQDSVFRILVLSGSLALASRVRAKATRSSLASRMKASASWARVMNQLVSTGKPVSARTRSA